MKVAGIDVSSNAIDIVLLDDDGHHEWRTFALIGEDAWERARYVRTAMPSRTDAMWDDVIAIGAENPQARGPAAQNIAVLHRVIGGVLACLPPRTLVHPWQPAAWRKAAGLPGNATKADVQAFVIAHLDLNVTSLRQDLADAYCIALATRQAIEIGAAAA